MKDVEQMQRKLLSMQGIEFNEPHMSIRMEQRGVIREHILSNLRNPSKLDKFIDMGEKESGRKKYKLYFKISNKRTLWIMISMNTKIKVLTTNYVIDRWQKKVEKR